MFVCICNGIREDALRQAARDGTMCAKRAYADLGLRPKCGQCLSHARQLMAQEGVTLSKKEYAALSA